MSLTAEQYYKVLNLGFSLSPPPMVHGLTGRIIRGKTAEDFEKLSDDPSRKIVFLTDSSGLAKMFGKTGYEMLVTVGHHPDHIAKQLSANKSYKIVVFPASEASEATWDGLFKVTAEVYPDLIDDLQKHSHTLKSLKYAEFETLAGYKFADADDPSDSRFLDHAKYKNCNREAWQLRAFLYHVLHIRELFFGDGWTYNEDGKRGVREYLMPNKLISDINGAIVGDINVSNSIGVV